MATYKETSADEFGVLALKELTTSSKYVGNAAGDHYVARAQVYATLAQTKAIIEAGDRIAKEIRFKN